MRRRLLTSVRIGGMGNFIAALAIAAKAAKASTAKGHLAFFDLLDLNKYR